MGKRLPKEDIKIDEITLTEKMLKSLSTKHKRNPIIPYTELFNVNKYNKKKIETNKDIFALFPDLELAIDIVVSSIISPNGPANENLSYSFKNINLPINITNMLTSKLSNYIRENYNIVNKLHNIIEEAMFTKGAYAELIIPDSFVDIFYNKYKTSMTIEAGLESYIDSISHSGNTIFKNNNDLIEVTENISILKAKDKFVNELTGFESGNTEEMIVIDDAVSYTRPVIMKISAESIIPIISKSDPSKHYGYFIVLDELGEPMSDITIADNVVKFMENMNKSPMDKILEKAKSLVNNVGKDAPKLKSIDDLKEVLVINKIKKNLEESQLGSLGEIKLDGRDDLILMMLDRVFKNKKTRLLFVPESLLMYYAYEYRENGTGVGLVEKVSLLASMKAMGVFVELMSYIKSAIPVTKVSAELDDSDPNPQKTIESIISQVMKTRQVNIPIGILKIDDIVDWVHKVGFVFDFNSPKLPQVKIDISEETFDIKPVDSDFLERINDYIFKTFGVTPEMVDNAFSPDFATTIATNNMLFARRMAKNQSIFNPQITRNIAKILRVDNIIREEITTILIDNMKTIRNYIKRTISNDKNKKKLEKMNDEDLANALYLSIINKLEVTLPKIEIKEDDNIKETYDRFKEGLEDFMEYMFNTDVLPDELVGELGDKVETIRNIIKTLIIKRWANENNYMEEVMRMFAVDKDGTPIFNILEEYKQNVEILESALLPFLKEMTKYKKKLDEKMEKIEEDDEENNEENENTESEETTEETNEESEETTEENEETENTEGEETTEENEESSEEELPNI